MENISKPERLARRVIYENPWVNLYTDQVRLPSGRVIDAYHVLTFEQTAVAALVENERSELLFVEVHRYVTGEPSWELPGGAVDPGESIIEAAQREVLEESGYDTLAHEHVYTFHPMIGIADKVFHVIRCRATTHRHGFDQDEVRSYRWLARGDIEQMLSINEIKDGLTLVALLFYGRWLS